MIERRSSDVPVAVERRKRGRKPLVADDPSCPLSLKVEGSLYDRLYAKASVLRMEPHELARDILRKALPLI